MDLFAYGTLMDEALVFELTDRRFQKHPARLVGYRKLSPQRGYPYIIPDHDGVVDGVVLHDVDADALRAFDRYEEEGRLYRRTEVIVTIAGRPTPAWTYVGIADTVENL
jgi:gamma-glutamylcyclotransferase (GGCT)/AIG2-like uncharacterized protein YtfP